MTMTHQKSVKPGFTLVELLVVLFIVGLVSAATLPIIIPTLTQRQVQEGSRILQEALINARFAAMSTGRPAGVRLLPDPVYNGPDGTDLLRPLAYNRMLQLEPAPDFSDGNLVIRSSGASAQEILQFFQLCISKNLSWRTQLIGTPPNATVSQGPQDPYLNWIAPLDSKVPPDLKEFKDPRVVLRQYKSKMTAVSTPTPVEPTSWSWNIRAGDRISVGVQNNINFVVAGPIAPFVAGKGYNPYTYNPERFINMGNPDVMTGYQLPTYYLTNTLTYYPSEILFVVNEGNRIFNGVDDNGDGFPDPAYDGMDNDGNGYIDDPCEVFYALNNGSLVDPQALVTQLIQSGANASAIIETLRTTFEWDPAVLSSGSGNTISQDYSQEYTIKRRMVPSANSAEVGLPADVVIDATTALGGYVDSSTNPPLFVPQLAPPNVNYSNTLTMSERSRLPIDPYTRYVDIIFQPDGQVVTSAASSVTSAPFQVPFYHLWLTDRGDVFPPTDLTKAAGKLSSPRLPLSQGNVLQNQHMNASNEEWALKNERRLITIQTRTGRITSQSLEMFDATDASVPYQDAQKGIAEVGQ